LFSSDHQSRISPISHLTETVTISAAAQAELAPTGRLRAGINYGNVILAARDPASGELSGVHVDLVRELARRAGLPLTLIGYDAAGAIVEGIKSGGLDVGLLSYEPARTGEVAFSPVYLEVEATYLVPSGSPLRTAADVDRDGVRIAVTARSAYEYYLLKHLRRAKLVRAPSTHAAFELFAASRLDALVGLRPRLVVDAEMMPGSSVVDGRFMVVGQSIASPRGRGAGAQVLRDFVEDAQASGLVARILAKNRVQGVSVVPPAVIERPADRDLE
jgi:polar amino acid transport system substrate-binding protein